ncbi:MAG TPA: 50S ribosomal protein L32 [Patescibacteria group bacterium]|nr:50S ribosomal protein L32 [Patescibacteria group bacterium]
MPQEPKRRHSIQRKGKRRASIRLSQIQYVSCPNCKSSILPHAICPNCGYYGGRQVISKKSRNEEPSRSTT